MLRSRALDAALDRAAPDVGRRGGRGRRRHSGRRQGRGGRRPRRRGRHPRRRRGRARPDRRALHPGRRVELVRGRLDGRRAGRRAGARERRRRRGGRSTSPRGPRRTVEGGPAAGSSCRRARSVVSSTGGSRPRAARGARAGPPRARGGRASGRPAATAGRPRASTGCPRAGRPATGSLPGCPAARAAGPSAGEPGRAGAGSRRWCWSPTTGWSSRCRSRSRPAAGSGGGVRAARRDPGRRWRHLGRSRSGPPAARLRPAGRAGARAGLDRRGRPADGPGAARRGAAVTARGADAAVSALDEDAEVELEPIPVRRARRQLSAGELRTRSASRSRPARRLRCGCPSGPAGRDRAPGARARVVRGPPFAARSLRERAGAGPLTAVLPVVSGTREAAQARVASEGYPGGSTSSGSR